MTDEARLKALMLRGLAGDGAAHRELLGVLAGLLRGYFGRRLAGGAPDLEDLVQDTLLAIHLRRDTYDTAQPFTPWAYAEIDRVQKVIPATVRIRRSANPSRS